MADSVPKLKKKLEKVYNLYIRHRDTDFRGYGSCISCGLTFPFADLQCGHYWPVQESAIRFDERNTNAQCQQCNGFKRGNAQGYALGITKKYGVEVLDELNELREAHRKVGKKWSWSIIWLREKIKEYTEKLNAISH